MSTSFDRWEKDPFFSAAEEVQESADRMEFIYRNWMHVRKARSSSSVSNEELRRELHTALGTAKWQLEEFDRASRSSESGCPADDDARVRHTQFVSAIENQILTVENSLRESKAEKDGSGLLWVRLDEGERDELAAFLSGPSLQENYGRTAMAIDSGLERCRDCVVDYSKKPPRPAELPTLERKEEIVHVHRRSASAGDEIGAWEISVANEDDSRRSKGGQPHSSLPKVLSLSGLSGDMQSTSKMNWTKNGFCKWRVSDRRHASELIPLQYHQVSQEPRLCYGRSKSCCNNESYGKQIYGWIGTLQRKLQRSQYQIQYGRPIQVIFWMVAALFLIVLFVLRAT